MKRVKLYTLKVENVVRIVTMSFWSRLKFLFLGSRFKFFKESE